MIRANKPPLMGGICQKGFSYNEMYPAALISEEPDVVYLYVRTLCAFSRDRILLLLRHFPDAKKRRVRSEEVKTGGGRDTCSGSASDWGGGGGG